MSKRGGVNYSFSRRNNRKFRTKFDTGLNRRNNDRFNDSNNNADDRNWDNRNFDGNNRGFDGNNRGFGGNRYRDNNAKMRFRKPPNTGSQRYRQKRPGFNRYNNSREEDPDSQWFKITINHGSQVEKSYLLQKIQSELDIPFTPFNYNYERGSSIFYVNGPHISDALRSLSRRISSPDGVRLTITSNRCPIPQAEMTDELTQILREVMSRRYNVETKIMDLSKFREDENLIQLGKFVPLSRPGMLKLVADIILKNCPDLIKLILNNNKLTNLESLSSIKGCQCLQIVDLSSNQLRNASELNHLKGLDLVELNVNGNPFCDSFNDQAAYISFIRSKFPKLITLDGEALPAPIGFELVETAKLPDTLQSFIPEEIRGFIQNFIAAYYNFYDGNRQELIQAYHDQACFSLSLSTPEMMQKAYGFPNNLLNENRNLLRHKDYSSKVSLLKQGKVNIVSALDSFPKTKHEFDTMTIDVPFYQSFLFVVVINGVYRELIKKNALRSFCRTFFLVPQGDGHVIVNDLLLLMNATVKQVQDRNPKTNQQQFASSSSTREFELQDDMMTEAVRPTSSILRRTISSNDGIIGNLMQVTGMNRQYAVKCLEDFNYNYEQALATFQNLKSQNLIPPEAFT